ncbi:phage tail protein [Nocardia rhizosphaerihabitans]|uniref:phage tail protein n=1 Tax=Nocardia rhizosphaerihabitans TaxID=1691570 RepID=UPI00366EA4C9
MPSGLYFEVEHWRGNDFWGIHGHGADHRGVHLGLSPTGLFDEPVETLWNSTAFQIGATPGGYRIHKRDLILPFEIVNTPEASWQRNDSNFRKAFSYEFDSKLWCRTDDWGSRWLDLRLNREPEFAPDQDPFDKQYGHVVYSLTAGYPRWREHDVTDQWVSSTDTSDGLSWAEGTVTVSNPTDTEMWLMWVLQAYPGAVYKLPDFSFGDNRFFLGEAHEDRVITMPALIAGEHLRVNTDEEQDQVRSDIDTQVYQRMRGIRFLYPIPPYLGTMNHPDIKTPVELPVAVKGAPAGVGVQVRCPRNWSRPWGLD